MSPLKKGKIDPSGTSSCTSVGEHDIILYVVDV